MISFGRFFIAQGFTVVFMYSAELVPTSVRNVAVGTSSMCARIGSAIAPYIVDFLVSLLLIMGERRILVEMIWYP